MISVIIPTHNRVSMLSKAIESVLKQTYQDFELIVVSDASNDGTDEYMNKIIENDKRIKYISYSTPYGACYARNTGIESAQGEYIAFLDDDDEWLSKKLEEQLRVFESDHEVGLVYTGYKILYFLSNNRKIEYFSMHGATGNLSKKILLTNCIGATSGIMIKTSALDNEIRFDNQLKSVQDYEFLIQICQYIKVKYVKKILVNYNNYLNNKNKQISDNVQTYIDAFEYIKNKHKTLYGALNEDELKNRDIKWHSNIANRFARNGFKKEARKEYLKVLKMKFSISVFLRFLLCFFDYTISLHIRSLISRGF